MIQRKKAVRIDTVFCALDIWLNRVTAGGNQNMVSGNQLAIHFYGIGIDKFGKAFDHFYAIFGQVIVIRAVDIFDILLTALYQFLEVKTFNIHIKAIVWRIFMNSFSDLRAIPHHFFGNAAQIHTSAAQLVGFDNGAFFAIARRTVDGSNATAAAANGDIVIMFCHG